MHLENRFSQTEGEIMKVINYANTCISSRNMCAHRTKKHANHAVRIQDKMTNGSEKTLGRQILRKRTDKKANYRTGNRTENEDEEVLETAQMRRAENSVNKVDLLTLAFLRGNGTP